MPDGITDNCCFPGCRRQIHASDSPPVCIHHMIEVAGYMRHHATMTGALFGPQPDTGPLRDLPAPNEVVYYVRIHDYVKIGTTRHLPSRMLNLRAEPEQVLAAEPGGRELEKQRHQEFAAERRGRREDFDLSDRLKQHIEITRTTHGDPMAVRNN